MKQINKYIIEKLNLNKIDKIDKDENCVLIVWSSKGNLMSNYFESLEESKEFIDSLKYPDMFMDGYIGNKNDLKQIAGMIHLKISYEEIDKFTKKQNVVKWVDYIQFKVNEKLNLNDKSNITEIIDYPRTKEQFIKLIDKYYEEWYRYDWERRNKDNKPFNEKAFKKSYQEIIDYTNDKYFSVPQASHYILPTLFKKYMKEKYDCDL